MASDTNLDQILSLLNSVVDRLDTIQPPGSIRLTQLADITHNAGLLTAGEFRAGNSKDPNKGFSGVRLGFPGFTYNNQEWHFAGVENDVLEVGINATDGKLYAGQGVVILDKSGIFITNSLFTSSLSVLRFGDKTNTDNLIAIGADGGNRLDFQNKATDGIFRFAWTPSVAGTWGVFDIEEDPNVANKMTAHLWAFDAGLTLPASVSMSVGPGGSPQPPYGVEMFGGDGTHGASYIRLGAANMTPPAPYQDFEVNIYAKSNRIIFQYNDAGTTRYASLLLTGTGVTWVHNTTPP